MPKRKPVNERWAAYLAGELSVRDMDDEELERRRFRSRDGSFRGEPPRSVPRDFDQQVIRELHLRTDKEFAHDLMKVIREQKRLALEAEREDVRMRAGQYVIERVKGKVPDTVLFGAAEPAWWSEVDRYLDSIDPEQAAHAHRILRRTDGGPRVIEGTSDDEIVDAEVVEDEEVDEERMVRLFLEEETVKEFAD